MKYTLKSRIIKNNCIKVRNKYTNRGITLIALVITIIVLLILAGVSIAMLTGENGILTRANEAKAVTEKGEIKEKISLSALASIDENSQKLTEAKLEKELEKNFGNGKSMVIGPHNDGMIVKVNEVYYLINNARTVEEMPEGIVDSAIGIYEQTPTTLLGSGTESEPYRIQCIEDLLVYAKSMESDSNTFMGNVTLERDLNFKSVASYNDYKTTKFGDINEDGKTENLLTELTTGKGFAPINISFNNDFTSQIILDGRGYSILNLYENREGIMGLFGRMPPLNITIRNLTISGKITSKDDSAGGLVGLISGTQLELENVYNLANVTAKNYASGLVGSMNGWGTHPSVTMNSCYNSGEISAGTVSGLIGAHLWDSYLDICYIKNSYNIGTLNASDTAGGLIIGNSSYYGKKISIINSYNYGKINSPNIAGGLLNKYSSYRNEDKNLEIVNSYNLGEIQCNKTKGGIIGSVDAIEKVTQTYSYYSNEVGNGIGNVPENTDAIPMEKANMASNNFVNTLNSNIESMNRQGLAKWIMHKDGYPTLDFNTIWDGGGWITIEN